MSSYDQCLRQAKGRGLKLCARGYCTAKQKFKVYPSAYANGYAAQVCNGTKPDFKGQTHKDYKGTKKIDSDLARWYREHWVNVCQRDSKGEYRPCGRKSAKLEAQSYPYCRPLYKLKGTSVKSVGELSQAELAQMCRRKRAIKPGVGGRPTRVYVSDLIRNPVTGRMVKADGRIGRQILQQGGGGGNMPNMKLVQQYNKLKTKQRKIQHNGKTVTLYAPEPSTSGRKKLKVYVEDPTTGRIKLVHFGHRDYEDYTTHRDRDRRSNYCSRSGGIQCSGRECDVTSANFWSRMVLWDC